MSTSCSQQYNLKIKGPVSPTEYWTLDEAGMVNRVGKIQATDLIPNPSFASNINGVAGPALFSNGLDFHYIAFPAGAAMDKIETGYISNIGYAGGGFSVCFWFNILQLFGGWETIVELDIGSNLNRFRVGLGSDAGNG